MKSVLIMSLITKAALFVNVPPKLPLAICWVESSYRVNLPNRLDGSTPSHGICQVKLETAQWIDRVYKHKIPITEVKLQNPYVNALYACKYIRLLLLRYNGNQAAAIDAYNKGAVVSENSQYVQRVKLAMERAQTND